MSKKPHLDKAIIEAAENEFVKFGIDKANMSTIAANAGVTKRTLYKYYESKEKLHEAILLNLMNNFQEELEFPLDPKVDFKEQLTNLVATKIRVSSDPYTIKVAIILLKGQVYNPQKDSILNNQLRESKAELASWLKKCKKHKLITSNTKLEMIADMISTLVKGFIIYPLALGEFEEINNKEEIQKYIVDAIYPLLIKDS